MIGYKVEFVRNPDFITIHVTEQVPFHGRVDRGYFDIRDKLTREFHPALFDEKVLEIYHVTGVETVSCHDNYSLNVIKGKAFTWADIKPDLLVALAGLFDVGVNELNELEVIPYVSIEDAETKVYEKSQNDVEVNDVYITKIDHNKFKDKVFNKNSLDDLLSADHFTVGVSERYSKGPENPKSVLGAFDGDNDGPYITGGFGGGSQHDD